MAKEAFKYDFEQVSDNEYNLELELKVKSRFMMMIFNKAKKKLKKKHDMDVKGDPNVIKAFDVPKESKYLNPIKVSIGSLINTVNNELKIDGIHIQTHHVTACRFVNVEKSGWIAKVIVAGMMIDKR